MNVSPFIQPSDIGLLTIKGRKTDAQFIVSTNKLNVSHNIIKFNFNSGGPIISHTTRMEGDMEFKILSCVTDNCNEIIKEWTHNFLELALEHPCSKKNIILSQFDRNGNIVSNLYLHRCAVSSFNYHYMNSNYMNSRSNNNYNTYYDIPVALTRKVLIEKTKRELHYNFEGLELTIMFDRFEYR